MAEVSEESLRGLLIGAIKDISVLEVEDLSGGCGAKFNVLCVSDSFEGVSMIERHRLVHLALVDAMETIHALELKTYTVKQYEKRKSI